MFSNNFEEMVRQRANTITIRRKKYQKERKEKGVLYLSAKKMRVCRKECKYSDKAIKVFLEDVAIPAFRNKKFIGGIYKGHMALLVVNYCATQYSEGELKSNFNVKRETSIKNMKSASRELGWYIRNNVWNPKIRSEFSQRSEYSYDNFGDVGGKDFRHVTWNIDGKPTRSKKFKRCDADGNKLNDKELTKYYYDVKLKAPGKRFIGLRSSDKKWRGCSRSCYPSGRFQEGKIIKDDPYCRKWFTLMNERDCVAADSGIGPSIKKLLKDPDEYYYEGERDPIIDETRVNYPPPIKSTYSDEIKGRLKKISKAHKKFGKKNIESAWGPLVLKNPGILSKHRAFRTDDGVFLSNLVQVAMELQNIEDGLTDEEKDQDEKRFFMKLYNGQIEFDEVESDDEMEEISEEEIDEEEDTNIGKLLKMFDDTKNDLIDKYEQNQSQGISQWSQT
jgi:hypothetical protein